VLSLPGDSESGAAVLDVGTEDVETEVTMFDRSHWLSADNTPSPSLRCDSLAAKRRRIRHERLERIHTINTRHCDQSVIYGSDVCCAVDCISHPSSSLRGSVGYLHCLEAQCGGSLQPHVMDPYWKQTGALKRAICTPEDHLERLRDVVHR